MKRRSVIKIVVAVAVTAAVLAGAIFFFVNRQPAKEVTVVPVSNVYTTYWGDSKTLDGYVTAGSLQEIYMTEGGFDKIAVKEGDRVKKGDVLVEYDNTQTELMLRGDLAKINLLKSQITAFEQQIINNHKKIAVLQKALDGAQTAPPAEDSTTPSVPVLSAHTAVDDIAAAVNADDAGAGTPEEPYRILCTKDAAVTPHFWETFPTTAYHFLLDVYTDADCSEWVARWTVSTNLTTVPDAPWKVTEGLVFDNAGTIIGFDAAALAPYGTLSLRMPEDLIEKIPVGEDITDIPMTAAEIEAMLKQLREDIDACNRQIDSTKWELRQAQITYEKNKMTQESGKLVAAIDGTVATLGDQSTPVGEVFMRVQGESRFAVTLYVNELMLREVQLGTTLQLMCYESGTMAPAVVTEIDTEPVQGYYSGGNANASTYQLTAEISDAEAQPRLGEWCQATLDAQPVEQSADTIYLPLYLIREDEGGEYVMRADEESRLQKQYVATGKSLWGSYTEIKHGVTLEDRLAFPYGKSVREGAPVVDGDYFY